MNQDCGSLAACSSGGRVLVALGRSTIKPVAELQYSSILALPPRECMLKSS
jgi:hypothetical protein